MEFWKAGHLINLATKILPKPDLLNAVKNQSNTNNNKWLSI